MDEETLKTIAGQLRQPHGDQGIQMGEKMNEGNRYINLYTIEALDLLPEDNILEIGMGNGFFVKNILSKYNSITYTGCDFSETMVEQASNYNKKYIETGHAKIYLANADKLPLDDKIFDKVFSVNTIYFWEEPGLVLSEIYRVLKPGGKIILSIRPKSSMQNYPFVKYGFNMYTTESLANLLAKNNFKVLDVVEKEEPEQEINGEKVFVESLIMVAEKSI